MRAPALALLLALALTAGAEAALPAPPFTLEVTPARAAPGEPVELVITPSGMGTWDVYLMWAFSPEAAFLAPDGTWSPRPVPFRARLAARGAPLVVRWTPDRIADIPLALVVVEPGGDPLARFAWRFRPEIDWLRVATPSPGAPLDVMTLAPLAALTLLGCALVLMTGGAFRA